MERERIEQCLEQVAAFQASGLKASAWAQANVVGLKSLSSWCAHARRWRARFDGVGAPVSATQAKVGGFVAARLPAPIPATVRVELQAGAKRIDLHWPVAHTGELAAWLREVGL